MEKKTDRLTILIDPRKKEILEELCRSQDQTPSQVVRRLIREYIVAHVPREDLPEWLSGTAPARKTG